MTSAPKQKSPAKRVGITQRERFIEAAHEFECDDDKERFEGRLKKIAKAKPTKKE
jgi:hypothetical protein